ncbi:hypothetical protein SAMN05443377_104120 [Propionibacterium cyclohexanicum]|uniref:Cobyrinic acid a,c-diamide synthase n=1 Tax=Propionibacterium cyclohexanicum TaxID=64702 RepID=A0A1H9QUF0_9ACTN|nr:hypothetical protein [Propionibacterium cyclohexanicum]SER63865.1 hypothetical protein SAMN05443377_104120 [Propionibacterium cyclohexanicum]
MPRKVRLPGAQELFRSTVEPLAHHPSAPTTTGAAASRQPDSDAQPRHEHEAASAAGRPQPSGRVRHDEKITVYLSGDELLGLERARLSLRARHGISADRGRVVRAAIAQAVAELDELGEQAQIVHRLHEQDGVG